MSDLVIDGVSVTHGSTLAIDDVSVRIDSGDLVAVLEAMKMEQPLTAHRDGTVGKIDAAVGTTVSAGHVLLSIND